MSCLLLRLQYLSVLGCLGPPGWVLRHTWHLCTFRSLLTYALLLHLRAALYLQVQCHVNWLVEWKFAALHGMHARAPSLAARCHSRTVIIPHDRNGCYAQGAMGLAGKRLCRQGLRLSARTGIHQGCTQACLGLRMGGIIRQAWGDRTGTTTWGRAPTQACICFLPFSAVPGGARGSRGPHCNM